MRNDNVRDTEVIYITDGGGRGRRREGPRDAV